MAGEITVRVDENQRADRANEDGEKQAESVEKKRKLDRQTRRPVIGKDEDFTGRNRRDETDEI
jgi:hypothetical protein